MTARMLAASGALALFVTGVFAVLVLAVAAERDAARLARASAEATAAASDLEKLVIDLQTGVRGFVIAGDPRFLEPSSRARRLLPGQTRRVRVAVAGDERQRALADRIDGQIRSYVEDYTQPLLATARRDRADAMRVIARGEGKRRVDRLRYEFGLLSSRERSKATVRDRDADAQADRAVALGLGGLGACVLLILLYALYLARSITEPVRAVSNTICKLSGGDLGARVEEGGPRELRALASSFNSMAAAIEAGRSELEGQNVELEAQQVSLQHALGELAERKRRIEASQAFLERLAEHADVAPLGRTILDGLCEFARAEIGTLFTVEGERDRALFPLAARGFVADAGALSGDLRPRRRALAESRSIQLPSSDAAPSLRASDGRTALRELHLPLRLGDRPIAVLSLGRLEDRPYATGELTAIEHLVDQAASALSNAMLLDRTREQAAITRTVLEATPDAIGLFDRHARALLENSPMKRIRTQAGPEVVGAGLERDQDEIAALDPIHIFQRYTAPVRDGSGDLMGGSWCSGT